MKCCLRWLLGHVKQDQTPIFSGYGRPNPHVAKNRRHHARRKFLGGGVTAAAIRAKTLLSLDSHGVRVTDLRHRPA